jgi:hypothetical protein
MQKLPNGKAVKSQGAGPGPNPVAYNPIAVCPRAAALSVVASWPIRQYSVGEKIGSAVGLGERSKISGSGAS